MQQTEEVKKHMRERRLAADAYRAAKLEWQKAVTDLQLHVANAQARIAELRYKKDAAKSAALAVGVNLRNIG